MPIKHFCDKCGKEIKDSVFNVSLGNLNGYLCWTCRDKVKQFVFCDKEVAE